MKLASSRPVHTAPAAACGARHLGPVPATSTATAAAGTLARGIAALALAAAAGCAALPGGGKAGSTPAADAGSAAASRGATAQGTAATPGGPSSPDGSARPAAGTPPAAQTAPAPHAQPSAPLRSLRVRPADADAYGTLPEVDLTPQILYQLLASEVAAQRGQVLSATASYLSLAQQTRDPRLAKRATELALAGRSLERAVQGAQLWHEYAPDSALAAQTLETLWITTGRLDAVEPMLVTRLAKARNENRLPAAYPQLLRVLMQAPDRTAALALFDRLAAPDQQVPEARLAAAVLAERATDHERAAVEAAAALRLRPDDAGTAVTAARYLQQSSGGPAAAAALLEDFLARNPKGTEARYAYARLLAGQGRPDDARRQMEQALKEEPDSPAILYSLAQIAYQTRQLQVARGYLQRYLALPESVPRDRTPAWLFLSQLEEDEGRPERALEWLALITSGEQYLPAQMRRAALLGRLGRVEEGRTLLHNTSVTTSLERTRLVAAEAQLLREANRPADAFQVLDQALARTPDNPELLYDHAMAAERIDRLAVAEASLRRLIELRPDNAHAYNALGYTFADRNIRLEEAQALIEKALELSPDDAHIVDSLGWVLYRRGRLEEALVQLRRAWSLKPEAEIAVHLGEVLWKTGRFDEARQLWREARKLEPGNETLRQTLARFDVSL